MDIKKKFFWFSVASIILLILIPSISVLGFWVQLTPAQADVFITAITPYFIFILIGGAILLTFLVFSFDYVFQYYVAPISTLTEETQLIQTVNPSYRLKLHGSEDIQKVARVINLGANRLETMTREINERISKATYETELEKNILAAIMAELPEGVIICNPGGQILFFNSRAKQFLEANGSVAEPENPAGQYIGLGRSIFGIIDRNCVAYALDEISAKLMGNEKNIAAYFVIAGRAKNLLRVETVPVLNSQRRFTGFIILLNDITEQLGYEGQIAQNWLSLITNIRHASAGIRSAVETMLEYPDMESEHTDRFMEIIHRESINMGDIINKNESLSPGDIRTQWPVVQLLVADLITSFAKRAEDELNVVLDVDNRNESVWVKVCPYIFIHAMLYVMSLTIRQTGCERLSCHTRREGGFIIVELRWKGPPVRIEIVRQWSSKPLSFGNKHLPMTLDEVMEYHHAEVLFYPEKNGADRSCFGLFLRAVDVKETAAIHNITILPESRPEFYDFNLFNQPGQITEKDQRHLMELNYTVFDTETTGLNPAGGDEIISIGAVRIVNGRLLREDIFDQLIDPKRNLPAESIRFHGIQPEMLTGQPTINEVLPQFQIYAEDTVLVAHNAAFDMCMLQVKEETTGIVFVNPVLDTLLLSAVVHPAHDDHSLEAIAERLGVQVVGRHTALGDSMVTGEIFLKLIPLLIENDIRTLKEALMASQKTYYARLEY